MERDFNNRAGFTASRRQPAQAPADRAGQDRTGQGQGQRAGQDAAEVLRGARLERGRHDQARNAPAPGSVEAMHHVILGAGPAGVIAAETIRKHQPRDAITIVGDEKEPPYSRMAIPYLLMGNIGEKGTWLRKGAGHFEALQIKLVQARADARGHRRRDGRARTTASSCASTRC